MNILSRPTVIIAAAMVFVLVWWQQFQKNHNAYGASGAV